MRIGILETGELPPELAAKHGAYPDMFQVMLENRGFEFAAYSVVNGIFPDSIQECDGWLITGSRHGVYEDHEWILPLEELIRSIYAANIPLAGICFGHQIMAQALGGKVEWFGGKWGLGNQEYRQANGENITLLAMHQDQVIEAPSGARVTMESDFCQVAGLAYEGNAVSYQPHPEFSAELVRDLLHLRMDKTIPGDQARPALEALNQENDSSYIASEIVEFFMSTQANKAA